MTSAECRCTPFLTCGHCIANAKPYHGFMAGPAQGHAPDALPVTFTEPVSHTLTDGCDRAPGDPRAGLGRTRATHYHADDLTAVQPGPLDSPCHDTIGTVTTCPACADT